MEYICTHIKNMRKPYNEDNFEYDVLELANEMDMTITQMRKILNKKIGKSIRNVKVFPDNWKKDRHTIISFNYKDLHCEICEHFNIQRNYLCLTMEHKLQPIN